MTSFKLHRRKSYTKDSMKGKYNFPIWGFYNFSWKKAELGHWKLLPGKPSSQWGLSQHCLQPAQGCGAPEEATWLVLEVPEKMTTNSIPGGGQCLQPSKSRWLQHGGSDEYSLWVTPEVCSSTICAKLCPDQTSPPGSCASRMHWVGLSYLTELLLLFDLIPQPHPEGHAIRNSLAVLLLQWWIFIVILNKKFI